MSSAGLISGCATTATTSQTAASAIDIHHHYFAPELIDEIKQHGKALGGIEHFPPKQAKDNPYRIQFPKGRPFAPDPRMAEVPNRLDAMTKGHVGIAMVEVHTASVGYELDGPHGETWSNLYNEAIMNLVKRHPNRFAGIATVPLQDPTRAAKVLEHAIVNLKMSGVTIASNVVGKYFTDKSFDPFWAKAQELDVMMIMHPEWVAGADKMEPYSLRNICGNPADTTLSVTYMMYTGVFDRFPNLKLGLLHGGGYIPYHLGRLDQGKTGGSGSVGDPRKISTEPISEEPLLRQSRLSHRDRRISETHGRRRSHHGRHGLSLRPRRLDGRGKNLDDGMQQRRTRSDAARQRAEIIAPLGFQPGIVKMKDLTPSETPSYRRRPVSIRFPKPGFRFSPE